jgi:hypothetical protein
MSAPAARLAPRPSAICEPSRSSPSQRVIKSDTWVLSTGEENAAAMSLWLESWHQVPAGSLPKNERMLGYLAQCRSWGKVRDQVMRGWVLCSDERYYHPVVAEKALESWNESVDCCCTTYVHGAKRSTQPRRSARGAQSPCWGALAQTVVSLKPARMVKS